MKIETIEDYRNAFNLYVDLIMKNCLSTKTPMKDPKFIEVRDAIDQFQLTHPKYYIVCIKACYVGQGIDFGPGDKVEDTYDREHAEARLKRMNEDPWALDCFELVEEAPKE